MMDYEAAYLKGPRRRLRRAETDLAKAERALERTMRYEPTTFTPERAIRDIQARAHERVSRLRIRVKVRRASLADAEARLAGRRAAR